MYFHEVGSLRIRKIELLEEFVKERKYWFQPDPQHPTLFAVSTILSPCGRFYEVSVRFYRQDAKKCSSEGRAA